MGKHIAKSSSLTIYSGVVSTISLRLTTVLAKLNDMKVWAADMGNADQEATTKEK